MKNQRYKLDLVREQDGMWSVVGYWEVPKYGYELTHAKVWEKDGARIEFKTRAEAIQHIAAQTGIPE